MLVSTLLAILFVSGATAQLDAFALNPGRYAPKPTVPPEYSKYFELDGHARQLVDSLMGPRPGGFFPEKSFEIGQPETPAGTPPQISGIERTLEQFFTAPEQPSGQQLPPGFNQGFSLLNGNQPLTSFSRSRSPEKATKDEEVEGSGADAKSSIDGIPNVFPKLPKAPIPAGNFFSESQSPRISNGIPEFPSIRSSPDVPEGGFLPAGDVRRSPASVSDVVASNDDINPAPEEYGGLSEGTTGGSSGGLIGTILNLIGLGQKKAAAAAKNGGKGVEEEPQDKNALGKAVSDLIGGADSPLPAKSVLSNVLYKALTSGSIQNNSTDDDDDAKNGTAPLQLTAAQQAAIGENLEMIQNLIIQPSSPLCTAKPVPVPFDIDAFMGQWYQVIYSPPLSSGACSMVAYKKLSDVNGGGVGSIFEIFEYSTDGTPYAKPRISSGYAIIKSAGELIYRTTSNQEDVNVHVIGVGPVNDDGLYDYAVLSTNCNYPLYVFARDPVVYKQKYEARVNAVLEQRGLINGFSRLFNIVAPVDNAMCTFPPSLFNIQG